MKFCILQLRVQATRAFQVNVQTATAMVLISVRRNQHGPEFNQSIYEASITENHRVGVFILSVYASDRDNVSKNVELH